MKRINYQKGVRVFLALLCFVPILLFFLDFTNKMPIDIHKFLHLQLLPAILGGMFGMVAVLLLIPRMELPIGLFQPFILDMRINLSSSNVGMAQQFLYNTQISTAVKQMGCK